MIYHGFSKKCHIIFKKCFFCFFESFWVLSYLVYKSSAKPINYSSLSRKRFDEPKLTPVILQWFWGQNTPVGKDLADLLMQWIASHFLNIAFYTLFYSIFIVYICVEQNLFLYKLSCVLIFFDLVLHISDIVQYIT